MPAIDTPALMAPFPNDRDDVRSHSADRAAAANAIIKGSRRDLLALLVGRPTRRPLRYRADETLASAFQAAFPGAWL
jgi:hypothetical protein